MGLPILYDRHRNGYYNANEVASILKVPKDRFRWHLNRSYIPRPGWKIANRYYYRGESEISVLKNYFENRTKYERHESQV